MNLEEAVIAILHEAGGPRALRDVAARVSSILDSITVPAGSQTSVEQSIVALVREGGGKIALDDSEGDIRLYLKAAGEEWTDFELRECVREYMVMRNHELNGRPYVKKRTYRVLSRRLGRGENPRGDTH